MSKVLTEKQLNNQVDKSRTFILYYHYRAAAPLTLVFEYNGDLKAAIERGIVHCQRMNYRFIKVRPFIVDLDEREKRRNDEGYFESSEM